MFSTLRRSLMARDDLNNRERAADPPDPLEGQFVIWMSDGTDSGDDGDIMVASTAGGVTKKGTLFDHSAA